MARPPESIEKVIREIEQRAQTKVVPRGKEHLPLERVAQEHPARYQSFIECARFLRNPGYSAERTARAAKKLKLLNNLEEYLIRAEQGQDLTLIPRQLETFRKIHHFLEQGNTEGHVTLPTGIGKTIIFTKFIEAATRENSLRGLVIGPTKIVLNQNKWKLEEFGDIEASTHKSAKQRVLSPIAVTTYRSLQYGLESGVIVPSHYDFLILDEAHRALGEKTVAAIEAFPKETIKMGFTATPEYNPEKSVADILPITIDELSVREAIMENLLAGLKVYVINTRQDLS